MLLVAGPIRKAHPQILRLILGDHSFAPEEAKDYRRKAILTRWPGQNPRFDSAHRLPVAYSAIISWIPALIRPSETGRRGRIWRSTALKGRGLTALGPGF